MTRSLYACFMSTVALCTASAFVLDQSSFFFSTHWSARRRSDMLRVTSEDASTDSASSCTTTTTTSLTIDSATKILATWDRMYNPDNMDTIAQAADDDDKDETTLREQLPAAILLCNQMATDEREQDSTTGRVMLGICAASAAQGIATLKSWVTALSLPRGLLHGMDKDGVPIDLDGSVYIKYNSGGVYTFTDIRKSGLGFDALWKPGDALLEPYDGKYRGVYFQVELEDQVFRQFLVPLNVFDPIE